MEITKYRSLTYLMKILMEKGIITAKSMDGARQTVYYWMRNGRLALRRKSMSNIYVVTDKDIEQIVKALSPGGKGKWEYKSE